MTDYTKVYNGISKVIWGYFFLYFNINLGTISILPSFVAYILFSQAVELLRAEERELSLLRPLGVILGTWAAIEWVATCVGYSFGEKWQFISLIIGLVNLYFHFQFITNLASIATKHQQENSSYDKKLLTCRTVQTIMLTVILIIINLYSLFNEIWVYVSVIFAICYVAISVHIMMTLNGLKKHLKREEEILNENETESYAGETD